jgi:hypothetical protein
MKRVLLATAACLVATTAFGFQADRPQQPRQPQPQYNQQLDKKPNEKMVNVDGWLVISWTDEFSDKLSIAATSFGPKGAVGFRCWSGEQLALTLMAAPVKSGERYNVEFRFDQNDPFVSSALAVADDMLLIEAGGSEHAQERFLTEFATAKMIRYRTTINSMDETFKVNLSGTNVNALGQVLKACKDMPRDNDQTSENQKGGKDA